MNGSSNMKRMYGKNIQNLQFTNNNKKALTLSNENVLNENKRTAFINAIKKLFSINLQKDDLLHIMEGKQVSDSNEFKIFITQLNEKIRKKMKENPNPNNFKNSVKTFIKNLQENNLPKRKNGTSISNSILLLYTVLYELIEYAQKHITDYNNPNTSLEDKERIFNKLRALALQYIQLREKILTLLTK